MTQEEQRAAFEREYATGDAVSDSISLARREDGEYEQALARMCFKWFCKGQKGRSFDFVSALKEAKAIVAAYPLHKKFIDGTPLQNDIAVMMAEFAGIYSGQAAQQPSVGWQPIETAPKDGRSVLIFYKNCMGKDRIIKASYTQRFTEESDNDWAEYSEEKDCYYSPEGWYEQIDNWDEYGSCFVGGGNVSRFTHWMPLPVPPDLARFTVSERGK